MIRSTLVGEPVHRLDVVPVNHFTGTGTDKTGNGPVTCLNRLPNRLSQSQPTCRDNEYTQSGSTDNMGNRHETQDGHYPHMFEEWDDLSKIIEILTKRSKKSSSSSSYKEKIIISLIQKIHIFTHFISTSNRPQVWCIQVWMTTENNYTLFSPLYPGDFPHSS